MGPLLTHWHSSWYNGSIMKKKDKFIADELDMALRTLWHGFGVPWNREEKIKRKLELESAYRHLKLLIKVSRGKEEDYFRRMEERNEKNRR